MNFVFASPYGTHPYAGQSDGEMKFPLDVVPSGGLFGPGRDLAHGIEYPQAPGRRWPGGCVRHLPSRSGAPAGQEIQIKHTPKQGSWLNIAELEFAVLGRGAFKKRIADSEQLQRELDAVCAGKNAVAAPVRWQFNLGKAREKMAWAYPDILNESS